MEELNKNEQQTQNKEQETRVESIYLNQGQYPNVGHSKTGVGVLLFFLGIVGLIVGLLLYPYNTYERKTFLKGWLCTLISILIFCVVSVLFYVIVSAIGAAASQNHGAVISCFKVL